MLPPCLLQRRKGLLTGAQLILLICAPLLAWADTLLAPGYQPTPGYRVPVVGSYRLPVIGPAADGAVIDGHGQPQQLHTLYAGHVVLLSFIYTTCDDVNGCPLATAVLHRLVGELEKDTGLSGKVRLITLSFNPEHDTPEQMQRYAASFKHPTSGVDWQFLTTNSQQALQPILQAYQQAIEPEPAANGGASASSRYAHLLRVFLIDDRRQIRNIYTLSMLHSDLLLADIRTLFADASPAHATLQPSSRSIVQAGDDRTGYALKGYQTRSASLSARTGKPADLLLLATSAHTGLPALPVPADSPLTRARIALGRRLFYDRRLSLNRTLSCAMCHIPEQGFTSQEQATAVGIEGRSVRRNAPTLFNVAYMQTLFHDGRESSLENQVWGPLLASNEMANPSIGFVLQTLEAIPDYNQAFKRAFGRGPSMATVSQALASYERALLSANSAFDRWYYGKDKRALSAQAQQGFRLFTGKAGCSQCHTIARDAALFTDQRFHNTGVGYADSFETGAKDVEVQLAPGLRVPVPGRVIASVSQPGPADLGRYEITQQPDDRWRYRTPSLRNSALTAPYMHNGALPNLKAVVEFYNRGGVANPGLDARIQPLGLNETEQLSLIAFLESLTGDTVSKLIEDAFAAPVGDAD